MKEGETKEDIYKRAKDQHTMLDRRLLMLLSYLKDVMEKIKEEMSKGET
ncbi:MAG: hypothetical protein NT178_09395 [Proteobacteria bacterium]|nr:hypothetical protein [Pseudomonadota bacterium]